MNLDFDNDEWRDEMLAELNIKLFAADSAQERQEIADVMRLLSKGRERARERRQAA